MGAAARRGLWRRRVGQRGAGVLCRERWFRRALPGADAAAVVHPLSALPLPDRRPSDQRRGGGAGEPQHHRGGAGSMSVLNENIRAKIQAYLQRYPHKQAACLPALHIVQDELRCVPLEAMREIAELLDMSPAEVSDTMTF